MSRVKSVEPTGADMAVEGLTAIRLIAGREVVTRMRSKAYRVMTLLVLAVLIGMVLVFHFVAAAGPSTTHVGVVGADQEQLTQLQAAGTAVGQHISAVDVSAEAAGRADVAAGSLDALVVPMTNGSLHAVVKSSLGDSLERALTAYARNRVLEGQIRALGGDPDAVAGTMAQADVVVDALTPPRQYDVSELVLGMAAGILIYLSLMTCGQWVAQGVVEEKSSRIVEILLATVRPWELMAGKVAGIGLVGLIQVAIFGIVGAGFSVAMGDLSVSLPSAIGTVVWLIVWYLIGFVMYAFAFAAAGALVSRQEDAAGVVMPVLSFVIVGYVLGISILPGDPSNGFVAVLSVIPLFAPTLMPMRLAMGGVPAWEAGLSVVLALAMIPVLAAIAGRIYQNAVMRVGARVSLKTALSAPAPRR